SQWSNGEAGVHGEIRGYRPAADDLIDNVAYATAKHLAFAERQVINHVAIEQAGHIGNASPVITPWVVGVLEEEGEPRLAGGSGKRLFVAERTKVAKAGVHTLRPGVVGAELQIVPRPLLHSDLQCVIALDAAGTVEADGRRVPRAAAVDERLGERSR